MSGYNSRGRAEKPWDTRALFIARAISSIVLTRVPSRSKMI
jgi:hypothetical protein